jgi:hypothetical protein
VTRSAPPADPVLVDPAFRSAPQFGRTLGPEVADLARLAGFPPEPEQLLGLDLIFALGAEGRSAAFEVGVACCRQNMKTGLFKQAALGWLFITDQRLVVWSAHEFNTSAEAFRDLRELIEGCSSLIRRVKKVAAAHGDESIELTTGQRVVFRTRTKSGGRGLTGDKVVLDEAMYLQAGHMGSLMPTLSARPDPQVLYGGSAGLAESRVWRGVRDRGRAGSSPRLGWLEWCDDLPGGCASTKCDHRPSTPGCRLDDRARWRRANPASGRPRLFDGAWSEVLSEEYIAAERLALAEVPEEFGRERLGWWDDPAGADVLPVDVWAACHDPDAVAVGRPVFGLDASPGGRSAAVVAATRSPDGRVHLEVTDHRPGTSWIPARCEELRARHRPRAWVLDPAGPAGALLPDLAAVKVAPHEMTGREMCQHCVAFVQEVKDGRLTHTADPLLSTAVGGAVWRDIGDGLMGLSRSKSGVDICPLVAAVCADFGMAGIPARRAPLVSWQ